MRAIFQYILLSLLLFLPGCKILGLISRVPSDAECAADNALRTSRLATARRVYLGECENLSSYQFDASEFNPNFDHESPQRQWQSAEVHFNDQRQSVQVEAIKFSTRSAAQNDPDGLRQFPGSYAYSEFRATLSRFPEIAGQSTISLDHALGAAYALCRQRAGEAQP